MVVVCKNAQVPHNQCFLLIFWVSGSPFKVPVEDLVDPSKVKVYGPGVAPGVRAHIPQMFTVDCSNAGLAPLAVTVSAPKGLSEPVEVLDNGDGTHTVSYTPSVEGTYAVAVQYAEEEVPRRYCTCNAAVMCDLVIMHVPMFES